MIIVVLGSVNPDESSRQHQSLPDRASSGIEASKPRMRLAYVKVAERQNKQSCRHAPAIEARAHEASNQ